MKLFGKLESEIMSGNFSGFGYISPNKPLIIDEYQMIRAEARYKCPVGHIPMPNGVTFTLIVESDEDSKE